MSPALASMEPSDPAVRWMAFAVIAAGVALALGVYLWFAFRNNR